MRAECYIGIELICQGLGNGFARSCLLERILEWDVK